MLLVDIVIILLLVLWTYFNQCFPDSKIASILELGKDKLNVVDYGIAPYFTQLLREQVSLSKWFVISVFLLL